MKVVRLIIAVLVVLLAALAVEGTTCEEQCFMACVVSSQEVCDACMDACLSRMRRVRPVGPTVDPWLRGGYLLKKQIGVTQIAHEYFYDALYAPNWLTSLGSNLDMAREVHSYGFGTFKVWLKNHPLDGLGKAFCYDLYDEFERGYRDTPDWWCETDPTEWVCDPVCRYTTEPRFEDMIRFWRSAPVDQIFVRFERWMLEETKPNGGLCDMMSEAPYYEVARELYRQIGWRNITVVFTDWEQDWQVVGCGTQDGGFPDTSWMYPKFECSDEETEAECRARVVDRRLKYVLSVVEERQEDIERARKEAWIERGYAPNLRVLHAVILNRNPWNTREHEEGLPTLAEHIKDLKRSPDLLGVSYWMRDIDPALVLDWYREVTGYPKYRFYIDEFGAKQSRQVERYRDYIPAFWDWGIRTINVWLWKCNWCETPARQHGLFKVLSPCEGRVVFDGPSDGLLELQRLQVEDDDE